MQQEVQREFSEKNSGEPCEECVAPGLVISLQEFRVVKFEVFK